MIVFAALSATAFWLCWVEWRASARVYGNANLVSDRPSRLMARALYREAGLRVLSSALLLSGGVFGAMAGDRPMNVWVHASRLSFVLLALTLAAKAILFRYDRVNVSEVLSRPEHRLHGAYLEEIWDRSVMLVVNSATGAVLLASPRAYEAFGYPVGSMEHMPIDALLPGIRMIKAGAEGLAINAAGQSARKLNGDTFVVSVHAIPVFYDARIVTIITVENDEARIGRG